MAAFVKAQKQLREPKDKLEKASKKGGMRNELDSYLLKADDYMELSEEINDRFIQEKLDLENVYKGREHIIV